MEAATANGRKPRKLSVLPLVLLVGLNLVLTLAAHPRTAAPLLHDLRLLIMAGLAVYLLYVVIWTALYAPRPGLPIPFRWRAVPVYASLTTGLAGILFGMLSWSASPTQHAAMLDFTNVLLLCSAGCGLTVLALLWLQMARFYITRERH